EKLAILQALSSRAKKAHTPFFLEVYHNSKNTALKRYALNGVARADGKRAVEILEKDVYKKKNDKNILWQLYGLDILLQARIQKAKSIISSCFTAS
ncbi:MAG: hypothetical protein ACE5HI_13820, partial [bacterium]